MLQKYATDLGSRFQSSFTTRCPMSDQVSKGFMNADSVTGGSLHPSCGISSCIQIWNACVGTVLTLSTMARQRASRVRISWHTWGIAPILTPSTTRSNSRVTSS
jgi:hypothetical protein